MQIGQQIRDDGPQSQSGEERHSHHGSMLIIMAVVVSTLLWTTLADVYVWLILMVTLGFGLIGFIDDYSKLAGKSSRGVSGTTRLAARLSLLCLSV
jgi:phospho-N-acetylmuramoyl-pentapeptide-transferase